MGLLDAYASSELTEKEIDRIQEQQLATLGFGELYGKEAAEMAEFKPYTVASTLGGATTAVDPDTGQLSVQLTKSPEEVALEKDLLSGASGMFERSMADPRQAQADLYEQLRAIQRPEEERQRLALEERMLAQGRMGMSSAAYGGANPELLAQEQARQEAMLKANLGARTQAMTELGQFGDLGTQLLAGAYTPQTEAIGLLGAGTNVAQLQGTGAREGASLYNTLMQKAFEPYSELLSLETAAKGERDQGYYDILRDLGII
jgi:hypothetical protein